MGEHEKPGDEGEGKTPQREKDGQWPQDKPVPPNGPKDPKGKDR
ncbi:hypothetical protein [Embleya sp. AB8]